MMNGFLIQYVLQIFSIFTFNSAGLCEYQPGGYVAIKLSEPLLKFRSREDMVNTLLVSNYISIT